MPVLDEETLVSALRRVLPEILPSLVEEAIARALDNLQRSVGEVKAEVADMRERVEALETGFAIDGVEEIDRKLATIDDQTRADNLIIIGLPRVSNDKLAAEIYSFVSTSLEVKIKEDDIDQARYLGSSGPAIFKVTPKLKASILTAGRARGNGVIVKRDFSERTRRVRGALHPTLVRLTEKARASGKAAPKLVAEKIYTEDATYTIHERRKCLERRVAGRAGPTFIPLTGGELTPSPKAAPVASGGGTKGKAVDSRGKNDRRRKPEGDHRRQLRLDSFSFDREESAAKRTS